ncbi:MAG: glycosyltransferase family 4 protein [Actinomycetia bacterium]|nr:glycosyltransferase family 4 protein [Actinomycetes bacterium]
MTDSRKLKIGLEVSSLINHGQDIGAGRYILNLIRGLLSIDKRNEYLLFGTCSSSEYLDIAYNLKKEFTDADISFKFIKASHKVLKLYERLRFPFIELLGFKADLLHCMDYLIPPTLNRNIVLTIHDLAFMRYPEFNFDWFIKKYSRLVRKNANTSLRILASSQSTADDIHKYFEIEKDKIDMIHLAAEPVFKKLGAGELDGKVPEKFNIGGPYLLSVGTIEPRKDFMTLIKAFNLARENYPNFKHKLAIAGRTGWKSEATYSERDGSPYKDDIIFTGRTTDRELIQLYNQADAFVYTSLFEGFGFPPLEAMGCGLPIICSNSSSMKEVVGNAGVLLRPGDVNGFSNNIIKVCRDEDLRKKLSEASIKRAKDFSWEETAKRTLSVYRSAAGVR